MCFFAVKSIAQQNNAKLPPVKQGGATATKASIVNLPIKQGESATQTNSVATNALVPTKTSDGAGQGTVSPANNVAAQNNKLNQQPSALSIAQAQQLQANKKTAPVPVADPQAIMQKQQGDTKTPRKQ